jgi:hypothetical protein
MSSDLPTRHGGEPGSGPSAPLTRRDRIRKQRGRGPILILGVVAVVLVVAGVTAYAAITALAPHATEAQTSPTDDDEFFLMQRAVDGDTIFRTDLSGEKAVPVFRHPHIEDFRTTASHLVVSVRDEAPDEPGADEGDDGFGAYGPAELIVSDLDGANQRSLPLPGDGSITNLQSSDRDELVGYTFTDDSIGATGGRESMLFTMSLKDPDAEPAAVEADGADDRVVQWRFVPDSDRVLFVGFDETLWLADIAGSDAESLGSTVTLDDVAGSTAVIDRGDGLLALDLTDGTETPLVMPDTDYGLLRTVLAVPGGGTLRLHAMLDDAGIPQDAVVVFVADDGTSRVLAQVPSDDIVIRTCVSPNGRYAATVIAPDIVENSYDTYLLPVPERVETHIIEIATGDEVVALTGFDSSWCRIPPQ